VASCSEQSIVLHIETAWSSERELFGGLSTAVSNVNSMGKAVSEAELTAAMYMFAAVAASPVLIV